MARRKKGEPPRRRGRNRIPVAVTFWQKVRKGKKPDECWSWTASCDASGYGQIVRTAPPPTRNFRVHRVSWELHFGPIPNGQWVLHHCDNPPCANPRHLYLGGPTENGRDTRERGRSTRRFNASEVRSIRAAYDKGATLRELGAIHGVAFQTIHRVIRKADYHPRV